MPREKHAVLAEKFIANEQRTDCHDQTLWMVRQKRDRAAHGLPECEQLREWASAIKAHTLSQLEQYLLEFEERAIANGIRVHWAADAAEHNRIVHGIISQHSATHIVKSKSMLTEEDLDGVGNRREAELPGLGANGSRTQLPHTRQAWNLKL